MAWQTFALLHHVPSGNLSVRVTFHSSCSLYMPWIGQTWCVKVSEGVPACHVLGSVVFFACRRATLHSPASELFRSVGIFHVGLLVFFLSFELLFHPSRSGVDSRCSKSSPGVSLFLPSLLSNCEVCSSSERAKARIVSVNSTFSPAAGATLSSSQSYDYS